MVEDSEEEGGEEDEEEDGLEYTTDTPSGDSYMTLPSTKGLSSDMIFTPIFHPFSTQTHSLSLLPPFPLCLSFLCSFILCFITLTNRRQEHNSIGTTDHQNPIYLATELPKQSFSSSTTRSCTGTPLAALSCSHSSKFRTSWTWSASQSASTT